MPPFSFNEDLLRPLDGDSPSGPNLEYDPDFQALERAAAPKAEKSIGDSVKAAEEPDWEAVADRASALLLRTKDLRVALHLTTAWLRIDGLPGWAAGLGLVHGLIEGLWDSVHPQLDAEDGNDPTFRVNSIAPLGDALGILRYLRTTPFVQSQRLGRFSLRDLRIANGTLKAASPPQDDDAPAPPPPATLGMIEGACLDCDERLLADNAEATSRSLDYAKAIDRLLTEQVGTAGPDLKNLVGDIFELKKFLDQQLTRRIAGASASAEEASISGGAVAASRFTGAGTVGPIAGPQEVVRRLDELCAYYDQVEPSSPVPLLLRRAQRLVGKNFWELLKDLAPSGVAQLQVISGTTATGVSAADDDE